MVVNLTVAGNMVDKVQQYATTVRVVCAGHPVKIPNQLARIKCERSANIAITNFHPKLQSQEMTTKLKELGWKRLKTLNRYQWLCPKCCEVVLNERLEQKLRWG